MWHSYANLIDFSPLPPVFLGEYSLPISEFWSQFPVIFNMSLVIISKFSISCIVQQMILKVGVRTGSAKTLCAMSSL